MKTLALEERSSIETAWKPYDPAQMQISLIFWSKSMSLVHSEQPKVNIQIKKQMPMKEFKALVESKFNLESAVIMKRTPMM